MLASWYWQILHLHVTCVILSGTLFFVRGCLLLAGRSVANRQWVKYLSYVIDTTLLAAAISLLFIIHQYPFVQAWLTVKVVLLVVYIALGVVALHAGRSGVVRAGFFVAALLVFVYIAGVGVAHDPRGWLVHLA